MLRRAVALAVSFALVGTTLSYAQDGTVATSSNVSGSVLVNHGVGYVGLGSGAPLVAGDRVMARHGGSATIVYSDGCSLPVSPGEVVTIDASFCKYTAADLPTYKAAPAPVPVPVEAAPDNTWLIAGGVLVAAAAVGIGIAVSQHHNNNNCCVFFPVTP